MKIDLDAWEMLPAQKQVYEDDNSEIIFMSSGLGSGKSHCLVRKALKLSAINSKNSGGILCPTYADFKRDILPLFQQITESIGLLEGKHWNYHKTDHTFKFLWNKNPIYVFSAEKPIAGPNLGYCLINEPSLIQFDRISEMMRRVRDKNAVIPQRVLCGTPEDCHGWLFDFVENKLKESETKKNSFRLVTSDTSENKFIDEGYRRFLESVMDEQSLKVFASGQIVRLGGNSFYLSFDEKINVTENATKIQGAQIYGSLDFNVGRMAATFSHKSGNTQIFFKELYLLNQGSNTYTMAKRIKEEFPSEWMNIIMTCDASGNARKTSALESAMSDVMILRNEGFNVRLKTSNARLKYRQTLVNSKLKNREILFNPSMKYTIKDLKNVKQKDDFTKDPTKDNSMGHLSDTVDYVIDYLYDLIIDKKPFITRMQ
jgi:hypothetical protein